ncbi:polyprenyl synthetase family protein [Priestia flexa]|uniref:Polyprenyl synthetase family protein n=1 Tax=Priestia flexa TaxID=86664 RepID=A0ABU4J7U5_9BACI|nr:farnesyl diphosphate synthase [Priestia flexa]MDW8517075.1 polyprenyl synthetase family protein [Priestia flexa]
MSEQQLQEYIQFTKGKVETFLHGYVTNLQAPSLLKESMLYSLTAGGKRLRPMLVFATLKALGHDEEKGLAAASAVEMIHTYSLIHDDLPSMDDDDLRRGKPTNHRVYGEATAILAGDALLTNSFQVIINDLEIKDEVKVKLLSELVKAAGAEGMIKGQVADMQGEQQHEHLTLQQLEDIHIHKTGKLLSFCVKAGAILGEATEEQLELLEKFSFNLGLAFQIQDDILDIEGSEEAIGKPVGSDTENEKTTYPLLLGMEAAKQKLHHHIQSSLDALKTTKLDTGLLEEICLYVAKRDR